MSNADKQFFVRLVFVAGRSLIWAFGMFTWITLFVVTGASGNVWAFVAAWLGIPFLTYMTTLAFELGIRSRYIILD
ncbi:hypothetical protein C4564_01465 [Candidatus Microgenomates bacterium]|nr:MAG: hypothetical protein C4564_01465 [Candidatus Microgenomates bacterium]